MRTLGGFPRVYSVACAHDVTPDAKIATQAANQSNSESEVSHEHGLDSAQLFGYAVRLRCGVEATLL